MARFGIEIEATADRSYVFNEGVWLKTYDPEAHAGRGGFEFTDDPEEALSFAARDDAATEALRISTERPCDNEGNVNRPLARSFAFSIRELPTAARAAA